MKRNKSLRFVIAPLLLVSVALLVFWPVCGYEFLKWDDDKTLAENPSFRQITPRGFLAYWQKPYMGLYVPVTYAVWGSVVLLDHWLQGMGPETEPRPWLFHLLNLFLHLLNALLVFGLLRRLVGSVWILAPGSASEAVFERVTMGAMMGALLFAVHPVQVEAVSWASGMKDLLSVMFSLIAIREFLAFRGLTGISRLNRELVGEAPKRGSTGIHYTLATVAFVLALLSKPNAVALPLMVGFLDYVLFTRSIPKSVGSIGAWILLALPMIVGTRIAQERTIEFSLPLWTRPLIAMDAISFYLHKLVWPVHLATDYGRSPEVISQKGWIYWTWVFPFVLGIWIWMKRTTWPWIAVSAGIFFLSLLPTLGLVSFGTSRYSTVNDRYLYLAMLGPALAAAVVWVKWNRRRLILLFAVVLSLWGIRSGLQTRYFRNTETLFGHTLEVNPSSGFAHHSLGIFLREKGELEKAVRHFTEALRVKPNNPHLLNSFGIALFEQGNVAESIRQYSEAIRLKPDFASAYFNLGLAFLKEKRFEEAIELFSKVIDFDQRELKGYPEEHPVAVWIRQGLAHAHLSLGVAWAKKGMPEKAASHYLEALHLRPDDEKTHYNLGLARFRQGRLEEAIEHYSDALRLKPDLADVHYSLASTLQVKGVLAGAMLHYSQVLKLEPQHARAHNNLGVILLKQGNEGEAVKHFSEAIRIQPNYAIAHNNLGLALVRLGKLDQSILHFSEAIRIDPGYAEAERNLKVAQAQLDQDITQELTIGKGLS